MNCEYFILCYLTQALAVLFVGTHPEPYLKIPII